MSMEEGDVRLVVRGVGDAADTEPLGVDLDVLPSLLPHPGHNCLDEIMAGGSFVDEVAAREDVVPELVELRSADAFGEANQEGEGETEAELEGSNVGHRHYPEVVRGDGAEGSHGAPTRVREDAGAVWDGGHGEAAHPLGTVDHERETPLGVGKARSEVRSARDDGVMDGIRGERDVVRVGTDGSSGSLDVLVGSSDTAGKGESTGVEVGGGDPDGERKHKADVGPRGRPTGEVGGVAGPGLGDDAQPPQRVRQGREIPGDGGEGGGVADVRQGGAHPGVKGSGGVVGELRIHGAEPEAGASGDATTEKLDLDVRVRDGGEAVEDGGSAGELGSERNLDGGYAHRAGVPNEDAEELVVGEAVLDPWHVLGEAKEVRGPFPKPHHTTLGRDFDDPQPAKGEVLEAEVGWDSNVSGAHDAHVIHIGEEHARGHRGSHFT